ncbi:tetratricopeptide repeat protein 28-like [Oculina patagonica]
MIPSLTSLKLIANCPEGYHNTTGALLVGDPCLEEFKKRRCKPKFMPLPFAREEVNIIGEIIKTTPLVGKEATKYEVLKRITSVALVHIAAHGKMETGEIALAPNPLRKSKIPREGDYILKISDMQAVQLHAKLVVLSCCHSAQGKVTPEGVVGIARAFLGAGARSVLVSLWAIDDEATMEFMASFYQHLKDGKSASLALNLAMKCLRESEKFNAVKYWAPFTLIGDDVTLEFGDQ